MNKTTDPSVDEGLAALGIGVPYEPKAEPPTGIQVLPDTVEYKTIDFKTLQPEQMVRLISDFSTQLARATKVHDLMLGQWLTCLRKKYDSNQEFSEIANDNFEFISPDRRAKLMKAYKYDLVINPPSSRAAERTEKNTQSTSVLVAGSTAHNKANTKEQQEEIKITTKSGASAKDIERAGNGFKKPTVKPDPEPYKDKTYDQTKPTKPVTLAEFKADRELSLIREHTIQNKYIKLETKYKALGKENTALKKRNKQLTLEAMNKQEQ